MPELKPCPFCGGKASLESEISHWILGQNDPVMSWWCKCENEDDCGAEIPPFTQKQDAIEAWNKRVGE